MPPIMTRKRSVFFQLKVFNIYNYLEVIFGSIRSSKCMLFLYGYSEICIRYGKGLPNSKNIR